jgi:hypothetical protein
MPDVGASRKREIFRLRQRRFGEPMDRMRQTKLSRRVTDRRPPPRSAGREFDSAACRIIYPPGSCPARLAASADSPMMVAKIVGTIARRPRCRLFPPK